MKKSPPSWLARGCRDHTFLQCCHHQQTGPALANLFKSTYFMSNCSQEQASRTATQSGWRPISWFVSAALTALLRTRWEDEDAPRRIAQQPWMAFEFMISSFDRAFLIHVFRSVEGVFKQGPLSHSLKQRWPDRSREGLCCRDRAGAQNKKPEGKACKQLWLGDHKALGTSSGLLQSHTLSKPKLSVLFSSQLFCRLRACLSKEREQTA